MPPGCLANHMWSWCDLDLWPFDLNIKSVHLCAKMHCSCKFGRSSIRGLSHIALANYSILGRSLKPKKALKMGFRSSSRGTTFLFHFRTTNVKELLRKKFSISKATVRLRTHAYAQPENGMPPAAHSRRAHEHEDIHN